MVLILNIIIVIVTLAFMECFSWFVHKYLFHGPLWFLHKTHHQPSHSFLEWNDLFALIFASISIYLMYIDSENFGFKFFIGVGISIYGCIYFIIHDWFVHRRIKTFKSKNSYLTAVRKAHKIHHKNQGKENGRAFGLLFVRKELFSN